MRKCRIWSLMCLALLFLLRPLTVARSGPTTAAAKVPLRVPQVSQPIKIDGFLNEEAWTTALKLELHYEVRPGENIAPPVATEVFIMYDLHSVYIAFDAHDPEPGHIRSRLTDRDRMMDDDWVSVVFDTFNDQRHSYDFMVNPLGVQGDLIESPSSGGNEWDGIWDSAGRVAEDGYVIEMAIPFSTLRFQHSEEDQIWGFDAIRRYPRSVTHMIGLFPRDRNDNCYLCQTEKLIGFAGVKPGNNLELDPTLSLLATQTRNAQDSGHFETIDSSLDPGLTARWGLASNLMASVALHPDFSQVEADVLQLNINSQFASSYPEKRPFFLEGADIFRTKLSAIYTRAFAEPDWGIKLTGKQGANGVGIFVVQDSMTNYLFPGPDGSESYQEDAVTRGSVARYARDVGSASTLGLLFTDREGDSYFNRVAGIDGDLRFSQADRLRFQALGTQTSYPDELVRDFNQPDGVFSDWGADVSFSHSTRNYDIYGQYRDLRPNFRADLGFMPHVDYRYAETGYDYNWQKDPGHWFTSINIGNGIAVQEDHQGNEIERSLSYWLNYSGPLQSFISIWGQASRDRYRDVLYPTSAVYFSSGLRPSGAWFFMLNGSFGRAIDYDNEQGGHERSATADLECLIGRHLELSVNHTIDVFDVTDGRLYTANISWLRFIYQINRNFFVRAILQYVDYRYQSDRFTAPVDPRYQYLCSQFLLSYKLNPQTVFFLGYSDNYLGEQEVPLQQNERAVFAKLGYALLL